MKVRSAGLALVGVALLVAAGVLGALLVHDGEARDESLASAAPGDAVAVKGRPEPFFPDRLAAWAPLRPLLGNHTYQVDAGDGIVALLTSAQDMPADVVLASGTVAFAGPHPTLPGRVLVLVQVSDWREPLLFR